MADVPFTVYFDFETTTTDGSPIFDPKMFVVSYCQIYSFHPPLNLDKIVSNFSTDSWGDLWLKSFSAGTCSFFNKTTFYQLKGAASAVLLQEKATSLAELFSVELKFTVDTLSDWFSRIIKLNFFEIDDIKKQIYKKKNPINKTKTICSICGFPLSIDSARWFDFIVKCKQLFLRNIYSFHELKTMDIETEEKYRETTYTLFEYYALFEKPWSYIFVTKLEIF